MLRIERCPVTFTASVSAPVMRALPRNASITTRGVFEAAFSPFSGYSKLSPNISSPPMVTFLGHQFPLKPRTACRLAPNMHRKTTSTHSPGETPRAGTALSVAAQNSTSARRSPPHRISRNGQYFAR